MGDLKNLNRDWKDEEEDKDLGRTEYRTQIVSCEDVNKQKQDNIDKIYKEEEKRSRQIERNSCQENNVQINDDICKFEKKFHIRGKF